MEGRILEVAHARLFGQRLFFLAEHGPGGRQEARGGQLTKFGGMNGQGWPIRRAGSQKVHCSNAALTIGVLRTSAEEDSGGECSEGK